jgi:ABC-type nitrate/sulfonate/bicarbonate transport system substrate-binding protein
MNTYRSGSLGELRRLAILGSAAVLVLSACQSVSPSPTESESASASVSESQAPELEPVTLNVGRFPRGAAAAFATQYMINEGLVEAAGRELGLEITVNWQNMANAVAVAQALTGGDLDIGPMGSSAYLGLVAQDQPVTPVALAEGHFKVLLITRNETPIKNLRDLQGKTVGTIVGTDLYNVLAQMILAEFGTADPAEAGIQIANIPSVPQLATVPAGVDATIVTIPSFLQAQTLGLPVVEVVNSYGLSGDYYDGPEGAGAGLTIETATESAFWPEGFYGHRAVFVARDAIVSEQPDAVAAFLMAHQRALEAIQGMAPEDVAALVENDWGILASGGAPIVADDLLTQRGWSYITEGDAAVLLLQADLAFASGAIAAPISWDSLVAALEKGAAVAQLAYDADEQRPSEDEFLDTSADSRGFPTWESSNWESR